MKRLNLSSAGHDGLSDNTNVSLVGYDLDGTICEKAPKRPKPFRLQNADERKQFEEVYRHHCKYAKIIRKPVHDNFVIITGRHVKFENETRELLKSNNINPNHVYFLNCSRTRKNMLLHKLNLCVQLKLCAFFEDDPVIAKYLAKAGVNTILVT